MTAITIPLPVPFPATLVILLSVVAFIVSQIPTYLRRRAFIKANALQPLQSAVHTLEPFLGLDLMYTAVRHAQRGYYNRFSASRFAAHGTTFATNRLLFTTLHTIEPENLKYMLATGFENYKLSSIRVKAMLPLFGQGIFTTNGDQWAHSRAVLRPSFTRQNMRPLLEMMERHWASFVKCVPADGTVFDIQDLFFRFTMDTATEFLMGGSTGTLEGGVGESAGFVEDYMDCCFEAVRKIAMGPLGFFARTPKSLDDARDRAWAYVDGFVDKALARMEGRKKGDGVEYNFLEELAQQTRDKTFLRTQVLNVLLASRDTTAALLGNMFYLLARKPEVYKRLRREVVSRIEGEVPTEDEIHAMTYLRWCLNETLRLYPVVPGNTREAARDTMLPLGGGPDGKSPIFVKKGTPVLYNVYAMHRRKDLYGEDADEFRPERWDGLKGGFHFLPFNAGPRICLGQQFALTEASYVTVRVLQTFDKLFAHDDRPWVEQYSLVMCSKNGVQISKDDSRANANPIRSQLRAGLYRYTGEWTLGANGTIKPRWGFGGTRGQPMGTNYGNSVD
ncbi:hypothetical protein OQA88_11759 [Cercophora sp. LCS_1]